MKIDIFHYYARINGRYSLLLLLAIMFILLPGGIQAAAGDPHKYHESGELTDIQDKDSVIIDARGYAVDPSLLVVNKVGRPIALDDLTIPTEVIFEYTYKKTGPKTMSPVITYIEETNRTGNNGRNM